MTIVKITNAILGEPATKYVDNKDFDPGDGKTQLFLVGKDRFIALQSSEVSSAEWYKGRMLIALLAFSHELPRPLFVRHNGEPQWPKLCH